MTKYDTPPKNFKEALQRLDEALKNNELQPPGGCLYTALNGKPCAIGYFLTKEQREKLVVEKINGIGVRQLNSVFGADFVQTVTGMSMREATEVQLSFDGDVLQEYIDANLKPRAQ